MIAQYTGIQCVMHEINMADLTYAHANQSILPNFRASVNKEILTIQTS